MAPPTTKNVVVRNKDDLRGEINLLIRMGPEIFSLALRYDSSTYLPKEAPGLGWHHAVLEFANER